MIVSTTKL